MKNKEFNNLLLVRETKRVFGALEFLQEKVTIYGTVLHRLIEKYNISNEEIEEIWKESKEEKRKMIREAKKFTKSQKSEVKKK